MIATVREREMEHTLERLTEQKTKGLKQIFKMARQAKKNKTDIIGIPCIRLKNGQLKVSWKDRIEVWKEYEESLLNTENKWSGVLSNPGRIFM